MKTSAVLQEAFSRTTEYDSAIIRQRVAADAARIDGAAIWPNGIGFDLGQAGVEVCYSDGRPWVCFKPEGGVQ